MTMAERMTKVETKLNDMEARNSDEHKEIKTTLDKFIESADKKYASKITEKIVYSMAGMILIAFMTKLLGIW